IKVLHPLYTKQKKLVDEYKCAMTEYQQELQAYQESKRNAKPGEDIGEPPERPILQRIVCNDTTIEKLVEILEDNPRGTLVARDELAAWFNSFTKYKSKQGGSDVPNWLETHRAGTVIYDRKTGNRPTIFVTRASVSLTGGIQPGI